MQIWSPVVSFVSLPGQGLDNTYMSYRMFLIPQHVSHPCVEGLWPICELQQVSPNPWRQLCRTCRRRRTFALTHLRGVSCELRRADALRRNGTKATLTHLLQKLCNKQLMRTVLHRSAEAFSPPSMAFSWSVVTANSFGRSASAFCAPLRRKVVNARDAKPRGTDTYSANLSNSCFHDASLL